MNNAVQITPTPQVSGSIESDVDGLIYIISHDVRNSMRALVEIPQWIAEDMIEAGFRPDRNTQANLDLMTTHARRLDRMMHDLLVFSRVGRMQEVTDVGIADAVETVLSQTALPRGFNLTEAYSAETVKCGERDILTMISAMISNVTRHTARTDIEARISTRIDGSEFVIALEDNGPGIPEEHRERVFEAMQTLQPRDEVEGSGMGLAIIQKIARIYGGIARAGHSKDLGGAMVEVRIPSNRPLN